MEVNNPLRWGDHYFIGSLPFINKSDAFVHASNMNMTPRHIRWSFHDEVFSCYDWTKPIDTTLPDLYKKRAQQLRDKYDYLSLFFSGGVDSTNVLHSFIDNDIFLDEIVMHMPMRLKDACNTQDRSGKNQNSELIFAAVPHLKKYVTNSKTVIRFIDTNQTIEDYLLDQNITDHFVHNNFTGPQHLARKSVMLKDKVWNDLYDAGKKVGHISGMDKPIINCNNNRFEFQFQDLVRPYTYDSIGTSFENERRAKQQHTEMFYWTPDLPELVIKQCQIMKKLCETNLTFKAVFTNCYEEPIQDRFINIINYIYPPHVNAIRNLFCVRKAPIKDYSLWFRQTSDEKIVSSFEEYISYTLTKINPQFFMYNDKSNEFKVYRSRPYVL